MSDDRPVEEPIDALGALRTEFDDFKTTMAARMGRRPTGDIEESLRSTPKENTLILNGSTQSRATYAALWQWAQDNALVGVTAGQFGSGDGSTTFTLPDLRGRVMRGTPAGESVAQLSGADSLALSVANMPSHSHPGSSAAGGGSHNHGFSTNSAGSHGGHVAQPLNAASGGIGTITADNSGNSNGSHSHSGTTDTESNHTHTVTLAAQGSGTPIDNRQASFNGNWLIWI